jgi:mercuric ion binding protein
MNKLGLAFCTFILILPAVGSAEEHSIQLVLENMTCKMCGFTVKKSLEKTGGVTNSSVDFDSKTATITFDDEKTTIEALIAATTDAGYPSKVKVAHE